MDILKPFLCFLKNDCYFHLLLNLHISSNLKQTNQHEKKCLLILEFGAFTIVL